MSPEELELLQKIVWCEARGEDLKGQMLVANVILNRRKHKSFPDTVREVIFQKDQFQPTRDGSFEKAVPTADNIKAVDKVLCGEDYSQGALFFRTIKNAGGSWHEKNLTGLFEHGGHRFYI